ncbi:MAG: GNAT family N-acetyltransferase [Dehalococcoidia bacterium]|nr:MAG: GNAT family N-acetyltransferase [Dehalococcoidia bacterium]
MRFPTRLEFHEVTPDRWPDFARLFQARGGPKHCWCSVFRGVPKERPTPALKKALIQGQIARAEPVGILGYLDGRPVAWCSVAPKSTFSRLGTIKEDDADPNTLWSITCFFVPRRYRGLGIMSRLIKAAVAHAKAKGARTVEAYPVDPTSPSYRFMGLVSAFERERFREVGRLGTRRHVYRRRMRA